MEKKVIPVGGCLFHKQRFLPLIRGQSIDEVIRQEAWPGKMVHCVQTGWYRQVVIMGEISQSLHANVTKVSDYYKCDAKPGLVITICTQHGQSTTTGYIASIFSKCEQISLA